MENHVSSEDDIINQFDWDDNLYTDFPDFNDLFHKESSVLKDSSESDAASKHPFEESSPSWIGDIENLLMNEDDDTDKVDPRIADDFFSHLLVDSPVSGSGEVLDASADTGHNVSSVEPCYGACDNQKDAEDQPDKTHALDGDNGSEDLGDPMSKKRKRQMRNRDAAVRSRERKKMHVRDLEMKSAFLEGECRRLGRLLQCFVAENQALRHCLQKGNAYRYDASLAKQESAVLLLESLLLGSLLWFLGIICMFPLPPWPKSNLEAVPKQNAGKKNPEKVAPRAVASDVAVRPFVRSRRCKASKTKMKFQSSRSTVMFLFHFLGK